MSWNLFPINAYSRFILVTSIILLINLTFVLYSSYKKCELTKYPPPPEFTPRYAQWFYFIIMYFMYSIIRLPCTIVRFSRLAEWPGNLNDGCLSLVCVQCKESFDSAWDLMVHAQSAHMMNVYQLTTRDQVTASPVGTESENGSTVSRLYNDIINIIYHSKLQLDSATVTWRKGEPRWAGPRLNLPWCTHSSLKR